MKSKTNINSIFLTTGLMFTVLACNNHVESIPMEEEVSDRQPVTVPFNFTEEKKIDWPDNTVPVRFRTEKIDFNKLPERPFDSLGFMPLAKAPEVFPLDLDKLPDTVFNYEGLPSKPLKFKVSVLEPPQVFKADLHLKQGTHNIVHDFGEPLAGKTDLRLFEDRNGFMWIGAEEGLYRFDGQNLLLYSQVPLAHSITEDHLGQIWVSLGNNNGICVINQKSRIIKRLTKAEGLASNNAARLVAAGNKIWLSILAENEKDHFGVNIIDEDKKTIRWFETGMLRDESFTRIFLDLNENIWLTSEKNGIKIIDPKNGTLKYLTKHYGLSCDTIRGVFQDEKHRIWITEQRHLDAIDLAVKTISRYDLGAYFGSSIIRENSGNVWVPSGSATEPIGVKILNPNSKLVKTLNTSSGLNSNAVGWLKKDKRGQIWVPIVDNGLNLLNENTDALFEHEGKNEISDLKQDARGRIWIGTAAGVWILDTATRLVKILDTKNGLSGNEIYAMYSKGDKICIITNKGLDIVDESRQSLQHLEKREKSLTQPRMIATKMPGKDSDKLWILTFDNPGVGLELLDPEKGTTQHISLEHVLTDAYGLSSIVRDRQGKIWIAYHTGGIQLIDPLNKSIKYLNDAAGADNHYNKVVLEDNTGRIWIGTEQGLAIINATRDSVTRLSTREGLINDRVTSLNEYKGKIYAGTNAGLTIITPPSSDKKSWQFRSFGKKDGLVKAYGSFSSDLITREGKFLWGDKGITSLVIDSAADRLTKTFVTGIDVFNHPLVFSDKMWPAIPDNDTLWGTNSFYLKGNLPNNILVPGDGKIAFDSVAGSYNMPDNLSLPHFQNYLQFHFAQAHGSKSDTTWYRYILEGVNKKWSERTYSTTSENYLNLQPGNYTFKVSSLNNGEWTEPASFTFQIRPPWWKTWWAYALYTIGLIAIVVIAVRYRSRKLKAENIALEEKIDRRTAELKQSLKELKATQAQLIQSEKMASLGELTAGIAHEIQNPLNFVNNFSDVNKELLSELKAEIDKNNFSQAKSIADDVIDNEEKINHHGKRADAIVKGMLQHSRVSSGQKEPTDINALADEYLRLSYHGLRAKDNSFNAALKSDFDKTIGKILIVPQDIGRVLLNLYNNAFYTVSEKKKQRQENYEPTVSVTTKKINDKIEIKVSDNGNGIPQKEVDKIFQPFFTTKPTGQGTGLGLSLAYDIVTKGHGGQLKVKTKEGEGTEFVIELPLS